MIKSMNDEKLIKICNFNKDYFEDGEEIKLYVELKNIPILTIKIFEICPENYYLKNKFELDNKINLEGLIPSEEKVFNFNEPPIVKSIKEFKFEKISKQSQGVFIVELIGNGMNSRLIIKKGKLIILEKITLAGHKFTILDEKLEICKPVIYLIFFIDLFVSFIN